MADPVPITDAAPGLQRTGTWVFGDGLARALLVLCGLQLGTWIPHYLTWPLWADHDVFATMARSWDAGVLPYRDFLSNNFPGTTYLFWLLGRVAGWGSSVPLYALDASLLIALGGLLLFWSRRCLRSLLPGAIGYAAILTYYLNLDFTQTAQRDWHGALLAISGLLVIQSAPSRAGHLASAVLFAAALIIRPHVILFLPAVIAALRMAERGRPVAAIIHWSLACGGCVLVGLIPLLWSGVLDDFLRSIPFQSYRPEAARALWQRTEFTRLHLVNWKLFAIPACVALLGWRAPAEGRRLLGVWLIAFAAMLLYEPLSPSRHRYLLHPLWLVWCVHAGLLGGLISAAQAGALPARLVVMVLLLSAAVSPKPRFASVSESLNGLAALRSRSEPIEPPAGYTHTFRTVPLYAWQDYRATLHHLRARTGSETRVANLLYGAAVTGPAARLSVFPAESTTWLDMVAPADEGKFLTALQTATDAVVVWSPGDERTEKRPRLTSLIRTLYTPEATFGAIEVWRRR